VSHDHGKRGAPCWVSRLPRGLRTMFPVQQTLSTPVVLGVVARAAGKGIWTGACRLCVAGDRAGRRRKLMRSKLGGTGCHFSPPLVDFLSVPPIGLLSTRRLRDNKVHQNLPVDPRTVAELEEMSNTPLEQPMEEPSGDMAGTLRVLVVDDHEMFLRGAQSPVST
jgi:hypothetical protein